MALIQSIEEIKRHNSSVTLQLKVESILSFIDDAINKNIIPAISAAQYEALLVWKATFPDFNEESIYAVSNKVRFTSSAGIVEFYAASAITAAGESPETHPGKWTADSSVNRAAFLLIQKAAVNFAVSYYVSFGSLQLSDSGAHVVQSGDNRIASDKKLIQLKRQSAADGFFALETAVEYLEANLATFTQYAASVAHTQNRSLFINSSGSFNTVGNLQIDAQLFANIKNIQRQVQDDQITAVLGESLVETLIGKIKAGNPSAEEILLITRVQKVVAPLTLAEAIPYKMITLDSTGVFQLSDTVGGISGNVENKRPAEDAAAQGAMVRLCSKGESELESLRKWLNEHATDYSDYVAHGNRTQQDPNTAGSGIYML